MKITAGEWNSLEEIEKSNLIIQAYQETYIKRIRFYELQELKKTKKISRLSGRLIKQKNTFAK